MRAIDGNVLIRYVARDDEAQFEAARRLFEDELDAKNPGLVVDVVLVETIWVLRRRYGASREELIGMLRALLDAPNFVIENRGVVSAALAKWQAHGGDFADALIAAKARALGAESTLTYDRKAVRMGMDLIETE